jgi:tetratricopeptide (TPR) repeat protein
VPVLERLAKEGRDPSGHRLELARALHTMGEAQAAKKRPDEAFAAHRRALGVLEELVTAQPGDDDHLDTISSAFEKLAGDLVKANRPGEAAALREREVEFWSRVMRERDGAWRPALESARACIERGELAVEKGDAADALAWFRKARPVLETLARNRPDDGTVHNFRGICLKWIGDMHWVREEPAEAAPAWEAALAVYRDQLLPTDPQRTGWNATAGGLLHNLGRFHGDAGRHPRALACFEEAVKYQKVAHAKDPSRSRQWLDSHYSMLAATLRELGRPAEAAAATRERVPLWPDRPAELVRTASDLARCIPLAGGDPKRAKSLADEVLALLTRAIAKGFRDAAQLKADEGLAPLRDRADFQKLLTDLAAKKARP